MENGKEISRSEYYKLKDKSEYLNVNLVNDTNYINIIVARERKGRLDEENFKLLKEYLTSKSNGMPPSNDFIVINYLTPLPSNRMKYYSEWIMLDKKYVRKLNKKINTDHYWFYHKDQINIDKYQRNHIKWIKDDDDTIKHLFYPFDIYYDNFTIVNKEGYYITYLGEAGPDEVFKYIDVLLEKAPKEHQ